MICCLCGIQLGDGTDTRFTETRPTGPAFRLEPWYYCPACWSSTRSNGGDPREIALAYVHFLRVIVGRIPDRRPLREDGHRGSGRKRLETGISGEYGGGREIPKLTLNPTAEAAPERAQDPL